MRALALTRESITRLNRFGITDAWFTHFNLPNGNHGLKKATIQDIVYIIEDDLQDDSGPLVFIQLAGDNGIFSPDRNNALILDRIILVSTAHFFRTVQIPTNWKAYSEKNILSFYAGNVHTGRGSRLHAKKKPDGSEDLFFFAWTDRTRDFSDLPIDSSLPLLARECFAEAILAPSEGDVEESTAGIVLCEKLPQGFTQGADLRQWYDSKLTTEQRRFVDMSYEGPVRLRGAAGTGKTLSLVVKLLRDGIRFRSEANGRRFCFVAHSQGAIDLVQAMCETLVSPRILRGLSDGQCTIELRTLYDLAHEHLHFQLRDLVPVSLDGFEGRRFQFDLIVEILKDAWASRIIRGRFRNIDGDLKRRWTEAVQGIELGLVGELMNEFACVIDAEHIRRGEESGERYLKRSSRPNWMLSLPNEDDRRFVMEIHTMYRKQLAEMSALSIDEMVADFNLFLDSNSWDRVRERMGFDAIFVDELHFFTAMEKQILQKLMRRLADDEGRPRRPNIFMAYDIKQSPRDSFLDYFSADGSIFSQRSGLQNSQLVQLSQVFRYTPEIAEFLKDIDAAFPAIDVPGEWNAYVGEANLPSASRPTLIRYTNDRELLERVFGQARAIARKIEGGGRRVAVICVSEDAFGRYQAPIRGRFKNDVFLVNTREATVNMRHIRKKFIFAMPEYVAGLQFDTVFLVHVNQAEAPESVGIGRRRQLISNIYLGASRAENHLVVCSCEERGGPSDVLNMALSRGNLIEAAE